MSSIARPLVDEMVSGSSSCRHIVMVPVDSVSPYAVRITRNDNSSRMRRIISTGTAAAPVTARRSDERSNASRSGWFRMLRYSVGGPGSAVMRSVLTILRTLGTSNTARGNIAAPRNRQARNPAL